MEFFDVVKARHCYRGGYQDAAVPRKDLEKIVQAGLDAPTGKNIQTTQFVIIDDAAVMQQIAQMPSANKAIQTARAYIACLIDKNPEAIYEGHAFQVEDCAAAVENMLLAIAAMGYASVWIDGWLRVEGRAQTIGRMIGVPEEKYIRVLLPVGVPAEKCNSPVKKTFDQRVWFNQYGGK